MSNEKTIVLTKDKDCKHSVRFAAPKELADAVVGSLYVSRPFADAATKVEVTIRVVA